MWCLHRSSAFIFLTQVEYAPTSFWPMLLTEVQKSSLHADVALCMMEQNQ
jgi:hypothetical protein